MSASNKDSDRPPVNGSVPAAQKSHMTAHLEQIGSARVIDEQDLINFRKQPRRSSVQIDAKSYNSGQRRKSSCLSSSTHSDCELEAGGKGEEKGGD